VPRRPPLRAAVLAAGLALAALALTACTSGGTSRPHATGPVAVPVPTSSAAAVVSACTTLLAAVPAELDTGVRRRPVTGDTNRTAAWGDPAITLRCGVALPDQTLEPIVIDGLKLVTTTSNGVITWTTFDRAVNVAIAVPSSYEEQVYDVQPLVPMLRHLPAPQPAPGP
jgi:hypothetical protein